MKHLYTQEEADAITLERRDYTRKTKGEEKVYDSVSRIIREAGIAAYDQICDEDLASYTDRNGLIRYNVRQALKAACHTRQDVIMIYILQCAALRRLNVIKNVSYVCLALLLFIALKLL